MGVGRSSLAAVVGGVVSRVLTNIELVFVIGVGLITQRPGIVDVADARGAIAQGAARRDSIDELRIETLLTGIVRSCAAIVISAVGTALDGVKQRNIGGIRTVHAAHVDERAESLKIRLH